MFLIVSCSSLYLCLFAKLLGQNKSTCCSAKLSTLRLFSLSCEQSVRWKRIPWSRSCECLSVHQRPGSSAVNSLGTTWNNKTAEASCNPNSHDLSTCCWLCEDICYSSIMFHLLSTCFNHFGDFCRQCTRYKIGIYHRIYIYGYIQACENHPDPISWFDVKFGGVLNFDSLSSLDLLKFVQVERFSELLQRQTQPLQCLRPAKSIEWSKDFHFSPKH